MPPDVQESGLRNLRLHFVREVEPGTTPADPAWERYSDSIMGFGTGPNVNLFARRPIGSADIAGFHAGPEDHQLTLSYHFQRWLVDGVGDPIDAMGDGLLRDADNRLPNVHSILARLDIQAGGALNGGRRIFTYATGARIGSGSLPGNPDSGEPIVAALTYVAEKIRSFVIDQPAVADMVTVVSTDAADTTQSVTIESEGVVVSETLALNGVTPASGATLFPDIDAIRLDGETEGDVIVSIGGTEIARILGRASYDGMESDLGLPLLGTGSFAGEIGTEFETVIGDTVLRDGVDLDDNVLALELSFENNLETTARLKNRRRTINEGPRDVMMSATVFSARGSHDAFVEHLKVSELDIVWTMTGGTITLVGAALTAVGQRQYTSQEAIMRRDNTFTGRSVTVAAA